VFGDFLDLDIAGRIITDWGRDDGGGWAEWGGWMVWEPRPHVKNIFRINLYLRKSTLLTNTKRHNDSSQIIPEVALFAGHIQRQSIADE
jgi:hypothetical protein